jgi:chaperonin cofactor prefoldin
MRDEFEGVIKTLRDNQTKCSRELESIKATVDRALQKAGKG